MTAPKPSRPDPSIPETRKQRRGVTEPGHWVACAICAAISIYSSPWVMAAWLITSLATDFDRGWNHKENP